MKKIAITSERSYEVEIGRDYLAAIDEVTANRERAAIIYSETMKDSILKFNSKDAEFFYFAIPDGEAGKSARTLESIFRTTHPNLLLRFFCGIHIKRNRSIAILVNNFILNWK